MTRVELVFHFIFQQVAHFLPIPVCVVRSELSMAPVWMEMHSLMTLTGLGWSSPRAWGLTTGIWVRGPRTALVVT